MRLILMLCLAAGLHASHARALFEKARAFEQSGDWVAAESAYRACLAQDPASAEALSNLGLVLAKQERYPAAVSAYLHALRLKPNLTRVRLNLGLAYYKSGDRQSAIAQFQRYLRADPENRQARQLLATALLESDRYEEAVRLFESLMPAEDLSVRLGLAIAYVRLRRTSDAQRLMEEFAGNENSAAVQLALGQAYLGINDFDNAAARFNRALELNPSLPSAHFFQGITHWKQQDVDGAIGEWRLELQRDPASFEALFALGAALAEKGDQDEAKALLTKARGMRPHHAPTLFYLGKLAWKQRRPDAAELLERSAKLDPNNRAAHFLLSEIYRAQGRPQDAARELQAVRRLSAKSVQEDIDILQSSRP